MLKTRDANNEMMSPWISHFTIASLSPFHVYIFSIPENAYTFERLHSILKWIVETGIFIFEGGSVEIDWQVKDTLNPYIYKFSSACRIILVGLSGDTFCCMQCLIWAPPCMS